MADGVGEGFEQVELTEPRQALQEAGADARIVSPAKGEVQGWKHFDKADKFKVDVPLALFSFNVGVELGQLAFVAAVLGAMALAARMPRLSDLKRPAVSLATYATGGLAAFWFFERLARF